MAQRKIIIGDLPRLFEVTRSEMDLFVGGKKRKAPMTQCWVIPGPDTPLAPYWYCYDEANDEWYMA